MSTRENVIAQLAKMGQTQRLPTAVIEINQILRGGGREFDIIELTQAVEHDPLLASRVLRLANSAAFGSQRLVKSVREAFVRLGLNTIYKLLLTASTARLSDMVSRQYGMPKQRLWEHSVAVAMLAMELAARLDVKVPYFLYTSGLLHDIGMIAFGTILDERAEETERFAKAEGIALHKAEELVLGIDHAEAGALLLDYWNFPSELCNIVRWHHRPELAPWDHIAVELIHVADYIDQHYGHTGEEEERPYVLDPSEAVLEKLAIDAELMQASWETVSAGLREVRSHFFDRQTAVA